MIIFWTFIKKKYVDSISNVLNTSYMEHFMGSYNPELVSS